MMQRTGTITFDYDGDEQRIRKTTPEQETLYFGHLYERVTDLMSGEAEHRYYVHSPERVIAIVTRGGTDPGTRYVHGDHLGSINVLTREDGTVKERRSYDPFGQRRNPVWGAPPPMSFSSTTSLGFTAHESDDELGLVNMKGRVYDPKVGRFLATDPIVSAPLSGQSWNPYSYVRNNPLNYVDPSGFAPDDPDPTGTPTRVTQLPDGPNGEIQYEVVPILDGSSGKKPEEEDKGEKVGAYVPPVDVSPTGNTATYDPQPVTTAEADWREDPAAQFRSGMLAELAVGLVPFGGVGEQLFHAAGVLPQTQNFRVGVAIGQIFGGLALILKGGTGAVLGGGASATGIGAAVGVPAHLLGIVVPHGRKSWMQTEFPVSGSVPQQGPDLRRTAHGRFPPTKHPHSTAHEIRRRYARRDGPSRWIWGTEKTVLRRFTSGGTAKYIGRAIKISNGWNDKLDGVSFYPEVAKPISGFTWLGVTLQ
jgi:RHS repeat-associated protein